MLDGSIKPDILPTFRVVLHGPELHKVGLCLSGLQAFFFADFYEPRLRYEDLLYAVTGNRRLWVLKVPCWQMGCTDPVARLFGRWSFWA